MSPVAPAKRAIDNYFVNSGATSPSSRPQTTLGTDLPGIGCQQSCAHSTADSGECCGWTVYCVRGGGDLLMSICNDVDLFIIFYLLITFYNLCAFLTIAF